jgi:CubicO group peptidase (beta-lactamase class C family)
MPNTIRAADAQQLIDDARVPGLSMAIVSDGQATALTALGVCNSLDRAPVDQQTIFDAASLSKPVFAYAVLQLVDAGNLALDTPLSLLVPEYVAGDPRAVVVTVRQVLSHTSGLPNWGTPDLPLKTYFPPGERFSYSGEGFFWLQRVVEAVTREPLDATLRRLVFEPLGMHRSSFIWQSAFDANYADPHDAAAAPGTKNKPDAANAAASLQTTADDYARFLHAVLSGARLKSETAQLWLEPQVHLRRRCVQWFRPDLPEDDTQVAWGLGWGLEPDSGTFFQWGDNDRGRFKAFAMGSTRQRCAVVVFTNGFHGMAIMPDLIGDSLSGPHPAFAWLGYPLLRKE